MATTEGTPPKFVVFQGHKYWLSTTNRRYYTGDLRYNGKRIRPLLHRVIWEYYNKRTIPSGYVVHHIDRNAFNNNPENLTILPKAEHFQMHVDEWFSDPEFLEKNKRALEKAQAGAVVWHKSEAAKPFHSWLSKRCWEVKQTTSVSCQNCGNAFDAYFPSRAKFCSSRCGQQSARKEQRYVTYEKPCAFCQRVYTTSRHHPSRCCSHSCANRLRLLPRV
jgi:hypothetical protein